MRVLANWIAKLVQFLYCSIIYHADCNSGPFYTYFQVDLFVDSSEPFLRSLVDLFVHSSGPFSGPFSDWGVLQSPENPPPWLRPCTVRFGLSSILFEQWFLVPGC